LARQEANQLRPGSAVAGFIQKVEKFGAGLKGLAISSAATVVKMSADQLMADDPAAVSAYVDRMEADQSARLEFEQLMPGSHLKVALQAEIDRRIAGKGRGGFAEDS
jgi:hypothetical protein